MTESHFDVAVIGAGVFGAWTAWHLATRGQRVILVEMHSPAHARASSGGESRIIRMSYGPDEIYTQWSKNSLLQWTALFAEMDEPLFRQTGVLWLGSEGSSYLEHSQRCLQRNGIHHEVMDVRDLQQRYPQVNFEGVAQGLFEPESGVLLARRAVNSVVGSAMCLGVTLGLAQILAPRSNHGCVESIATTDRDLLCASQYVFACGPWLGKLFPELLGARLFVTRQEVFFFGTPPGSTRFSPPALPTWFFQSDQVYGMPDIEGRGLKIACDVHGARVDPDTQSRLASREAAIWASDYVSRRFPALNDAPIVETRVCQYENTSSGDFLIDRHPQFSNVWLVGGGSGHGFKHGPAVGGHVAGLVLGEHAVNSRFSLAGKATQQQRSVH